MEKTKIKLVGKYHGHQVKPNKIVQLTLKFPYDQLPRTIQTLQMLNENVTIKAKVPSEKPFNVGMFTINQVNFDHDGECVIRLNSTIDYVEIDNISKLILEAEESAQLSFEAEIDLEKGDDNDE